MTALQFRVASLEDPKEDSLALVAEVLRRPGTKAH